MTSGSQKKKLVSFFLLCALLEFALVSLGA